jgi:nucleoside 2-deoxyribosyltransferase
MHDRDGSVYQKAIAFERDVASAYRALGAEVQHNVAIAGNQIDILLKETTTSGTTIRTIVECKAYSSPVGVQVVRQFAALVNLLKTRGLIDRAIVVSLSGYSQSARQSAEKFGIDLVEMEDLKARLGDNPDLLIKANEQIGIQEQTAQATTKKIFVVMPFAQEFNDVYILGIREVAEKLGFVVERSDDVEHIESIIDVIREKIRRCDGVIADTTGRNPNVFYEIGFADGTERPVVLVCRESEPIPFDLAGTNFIKYASIVDLRERLERRLRAVFVD